MRAAATGSRSRSRSCCSPTGAATQVLKVVLDEGTLKPGSFPSGHATAALTLALCAALAAPARLRPHGDRRRRRARRGGLVRDRLARLAFPVGHPRRLPRRGDADGRRRGRAAARGGAPRRDAAAARHGRPRRSPGSRRSRASRASAPPLVLTSLSRRRAGGRRSGAHDGHSRRGGHRRACGDAARRLRADRALTLSGARARRPTRPGAKRCTSAPRATNIPMTARIGAMHRGWQ